MAVLGAEFIVPSIPADAHTPAIATLSGGQFVVTWLSGNELRGRIFHADGSPSTGNLAIAGSFNGSLVPGFSKVTALPDGHFVATWHSFDNGDGSPSVIRAHVFNSDGTPSGGPFVVNSTGAGNQFTPAIAALSNGQFVATWNSADGGDGSGELIRARLFNGSGVALGNDFIVNTTSGGDQFFPEIAAVPNGRFFIVWRSRDTGEVRGRLFDTDGTPISADFIVNSTASTDQGRTNIAALSDGRFVVTWSSSDGADGSESVIRARIFNVDATPAGADFIVNTATAGHQLNVDIAALPDGRFILTWFSYDGGDGAGTVLRGRLFNADATPAGNDFIVNSIPAGNQYDSAVTALPDGRVVVTWYADVGGFLRLSAVSFDPDGPGITVTGTDFHDIISGTPVNDMLSGLDGIDVIWAGAGNDTLAGGAGADQLNGGEGIDTADYSTSAAAVVVNLATASGYTGDAQGDALYGIENLTGSAGADSLYGNSSANLFNGGAGADIMGGGAGDDAYFADSNFDWILESVGGGVDAVYASVTYALFANVEHLYLQGSANLAAYGNSLDNFMVGNSGDNALDGGAGADTMQGNTGSDAYFVDTSFDVITEDLGEGFDAVYSTQTYVLGANLEHLYLQGTAVGGFGNTLANFIQGNASDNGINGLGGADVLEGNGGNDLFAFNAGQANGDALTDFNGNGAGLGDSMQFSGFGTVAQGATFTQIGATNHWTIHSGIDGHDEIITFNNGAAIQVSDWSFV